MNLPTRQDINPVPTDLDGRSAARHFLGKTREQITTEFAEHGMSYQEDLMFMGPRAFIYYFPAALDYITSPQGSTDVDVASCLISVVEHRLKYSAREIRGAFPQIAQFADYILAHYDGFGFDPNIYGDVRPRLNHIKKFCAEPGAAPNAASPHR